LAPAHRIGLFRAFWGVESTSSRCRGGSIPPETLAPKKNWRLSLNLTLIPQWKNRQSVWRVFWNKSGGRQEKKGKGAGIFLDFFLEGVGSLTRSSEAPPSAGDIRHSLKAKKFFRGRGGTQHMWFSFCSSPSSTSSKKFFAFRRAHIQPARTGSLPGRQLVRSPGRQL